MDFVLGLLLGAVGGVVLTIVLSALMVADGGNGDE